MFDFFSVQKFAKTSRVIRLIARYVARSFRRPSLAATFDHSYERFELHRSANQRSPFRVHAEFKKENSGEHFYFYYAPCRKKVKQEPA